jgi:hypothetical protein
MAVIHYCLCSRPLQTLEGAKQYVRDWVSTMQPEYLMASTPHDFAYQRHHG